MRYTSNPKAVMDALSLLDWLRGFPEEDNKRMIVAMSVASFADDRPHIHPDLGTEPIVPLSWLILEIAKSATWFPRPIEMRKIYERRWAPLDGRGAADLEESLA